MATVKCANCGKQVNSFAVLCPQCGGGVHSRGGKFPWPAVLASGCIAAVAWFAIDRMTDIGPRPEHLQALDDQINQSQKLLDDAAAANAELQKRLKQPNP